MGRPALTQFPPSTAVMGEEIAFRLSALAQGPVTSPACPFMGGGPSVQVKPDGNVLEGGSRGGEEGCSMWWPCALPEFFLDT